MVTVTCPGSLGGSDKVEGGAGAMGRLGTVGFGGGCEQKTTRHRSTAFPAMPFIPHTRTNQTWRAPGRMPEASHVLSLSITASPLRCWHCHVTDVETYKARLSPLLRATQTVKTRTGNKAQICMAHSPHSFFYTVPPPKFGWK